MSFFSLLTAFLLDQLRTVGADNRPLQWFRTYSQGIERNFNAGQLRHGVVGWVLAVGAPLLAGLLLYFALYRLSPLLGWALNVAVLYFTVSLRQAGTPYAAIGEALKNQDLEAARAALQTWTGQPADDLTAAEMAKLAIEQRLLEAHRDGFGVIAWFLLLPGPCGALLYRLASELDRTWGARSDEEFGRFGEFARQTFAVLDWLPARLTAASFAVAGDFEDAVYCWRSQALSWVPHRQGILLASGAGAIGIRLGDAVREGNSIRVRPELGTGDEPDADYMKSASGLVWRVLALWMGLLLLVSLAHWVG
jgi:cobalamin biosynthesis protein CobD/CbiB